MTLLEYLGKQSRRSLWLQGVLGVLVVGYLDYYTGVELALSAFYLAPISLMAFFLGRSAGVWSACLSAVLWLACELIWGREYSHPFIPFWNAIVRGAIFLAGALLIAEIAHRKKVEATLRKQSSILQSILDSMGDGVIVADQSERIILHNPAADRLLNIPSEPTDLREWLRKQRIYLPDRLTPLPFADHPMLKAIRGESTDGVELFLRDDKTNRETWLSATGRGLIDDNKKIAGGVLVLSDLTSRKTLEKQVAEISDREQLRIGQDLHDGVCQKLVSTAFAASVLQQKLEKQKLGEAASAEQIVDMINDAVQDARGLARGLYPVRVELDGLEPALETLVDSVQSYSNISCRFVCNGPILIHDTVASVNLYRIAQEALNNAVKHSKATEILVEFEAVEDEVTLSVQDNGVGYVPKNSAAPSVRDGSGMGLHIMKYRAKLIGASLDVRRATNGGTIVICSFLNNSQVNKTHEHILPR